MMIAEMRRRRMKKTNAAASHPAISIPCSVFSRLHDVSACLAFSDTTTSPRRVGGTPLGRGHCTASPLSVPCFHHLFSFFSLLVVIHPYGAGSVTALASGVTAPIRANVMEIGHGFMNMA